MIDTPPMILPTDAQAIAEGCWFDAAFAAKKIAWIEKNLNMRLYAWQRDSLTMYYGWRRPNGKPKGTFRFNEIQIWIPKKNGKTTLIAALVGEKLFSLHRKRIISSAYNSNQSKLVMEELVRFLRGSPYLSHLFKTREGALREATTPQRKLTNKITDTWYLAIADNVKANDGLACDVLVLDEIHRMEDRQVDVIEGAIYNHPNPLKVILSTAGSGDKTERCWERYQEAKAVLSGEKQDTHMLPIIYECPHADTLKGDDIFNMDLVVACNPALQEFPDMLASATRDMGKAKKNRAYNQWLRFRLNHWCQEDGDLYITDEAYAACEVTPAEAPDLTGADCYVGFDNSGGVSDFYAFAFLFPLDDGRLFEQHYVFAVEDRLDDMSNDDDRKYTLDVERGDLIVIPADAVADEFLYNWCKEKFSHHNVKNIAGDPAWGKYLLDRFTADYGNDMVKAVKQSDNRGLSPNIADYATRIHQEKNIHTHQGLVTWQLSHARRITTAKDCSKLVKQGTNRQGHGGTGHIDSIDAIINAFAAWREDEIVRAATGNRIGITAFLD